MMILPAWNGYIRGTMFRLGVSLDEMAMRANVSRTYMSKRLAHSKNTDRCKAKIEKALLECAKVRGLTAADIGSADGFSSYTVGAYAC